MPTKKNNAKKQSTTKSHQNAKMTDSDSENLVWEQFAKRHNGNPFLDLNPLYALPLKLIDVLNQKKLFTAADLAFERDLADLTGGGFWRHFRFGYSPLGNFYGSAKQETIASKESDAQLRSILELLVPRDALREQWIARNAEQSQRYNESVDFQIAAYAGWLIGNPEFCRDKMTLRTAYGAKVDKCAAFPEFPMSFFGEAPKRDRRFSKNCAAEFDFFYRKWGLQRLVTWDLPLPLRPQVGQVLYSLPHQATTVAHNTSPWLSTAGLLVFLPPAVLKDKDLTVQELVSQAGNLADRKHLNEWLKYGRTETKLGIKRWERMLKIYRYTHLALIPRYAARKNWRTTLVDEALTSFVNCGGVENVRRARQELERRLKKCSA